MKETFQENALTVVEKRTRFEGSNICTWIGFKHVMYLVEEAILEHFRESGWAPRDMFENHGLCLEILDSNVRILHALHMDDKVKIHVTPKSKAGESELAYGVELFVSRDGKELKALTGKVRAQFRQDLSGVTNPVSLPALAPYTVPEIKRSRPGLQSTDLDLQSRGTVNPGDELIKRVVPEDANAFVWKWHIPYFYCHFTERIQHSGYLRLMEEVVDLFLADRGISIWNMLETKKWIPVVPSASVEILQEAYMEETLYTVYTVEDIFKDATYISRMDCFVQRGNSLIKVATGRITHGYAVIENRKDWSLVALDEKTLQALRGKSAK